MSKYIYLVIALAVIGGLYIFGLPYFSAEIVLGEIINVDKNPFSRLPVQEPVKVPILIYHHIRSLPETGEDITLDRTFFVQPQNFERQMEYLTENNFTTISMENLADYFSGSFDLPQKPVIITFDDGVIDQYENAFPVLKKYNLTATFYVFANPIGRSKNYITREQLEEIYRSGMEIGNHGWYHLYLDRISAAELNREIVLSKQRLEEQLGHEISTFAYPFGSYNDKIVKTVKGAEYRTVRDIVNGVWHSQDDLYSLNGYFITDSFPRFISIISQ